MPKSKIHLLAIDLDHTLLNDQGQISAYNQEQIHRAVDLGYQVVICTGRPWGGMKRYVDQFDFWQEGDYAISMNGAQVHDLTDQSLVYNQVLVPEARQTLLEEVAALDLPQIQVVASSADQVSVLGSDPLNAAVQQDIDLLQMPYERLTYQEALDRTDINKLLILGDAESLDQAEAALRDLNLAAVDLIRSLETVLEAVIPGVNKASGLAWLTDQLGLDSQSVMVFGDGMNDLEMFEYAGYSVAMANARPALKEVADEVTLSNLEDGVGHTLARLFQEEGQSFTKK